MASDNALQANQGNDLGALIRRRKPLDDAEMDITPMIDITFLLLIFFIVAAKIDDNSGVNLPPANFGVPVSAKESVVITIDAAPDGTGVIYLGDTTEDSAKVTTTDRADLTDAIQEFAEKEMSDPRKQTVLIKGSGELKHREVAKVLSAIGAGVEVEVVYIAVLEK